MLSTSISLSVKLLFNKFIYNSRDVMPLYEFYDGKISECIFNLFGWY